MRNLRISDFGSARIFKISCVVSVAALAAGCSVGSDRFDAITGSTGNSSSSASTDSGSDYNSNPGYSDQVSTTSLPGPAPSASPAYGSVAGSDGVVRVSRGDTLYSISRANNIDVKDLIAANNLQPPYQLSVGQQIRLPGSSGQSTVATASPVQTVSPQQDGSHKVAGGETLYSLGRTYNISPMSIAKANNLNAPYSLKGGQVVRIPSGGQVGTSPVLANDTTGQSSGAPTTNTTTSAKSSAIPAPLPEPGMRTSSTFRWPLKGRVISAYGPKTNGSRNDGINIAVPEGTSVRAAENGVVAYSGNELKGYGNLILIRHEGGWVTAYAHNKTLHVKRGDKVTRGSVIAKAGSSGSVSSPQLHFEIRKGAEAVNPMKHLPSNFASN